MPIRQLRQLIVPLALEDDDFFLARLREAQEAPPPVPDVVHPFTLRVYAELPLAYRDADEQFGWPLLSWLSLLLDQIGAAVDLYDRIDARTVDEGGSPSETSDLTDPLKADAAWLPWLAQHVGVKTKGLTVSEQRAAIAGASSGFAVGTKGAVAAAAATALTGGQFVRVYDHSTTTPGDGGQWDVLIVTRSEETPNPAAVTAAVIAAGAKPAGVVLHQRSYSASWTAEQTAFPTWADRNGRPWLDIEEAGL